MTFKFIGALKKFFLGDPETEVANVLRRFYLEDANGRVPYEAGFREGYRKGRSDTVCDSEHACTCGSGLHPRSCKRHSWAYSAHVDEIDAENLAIEVASNEEVKRLKSKVEELKRQLTSQRENNEKRNRELDALHYVWCSGGCDRGVHRYDGNFGDITEEVVVAGERQVARLREWFEARKDK